ncbi:MAG: PhzF family phenazine biosynthesis protein [Hyphomicrobiaceae bacterium]
MDFDYHILDVFTDQRFGGNPLAVVLGAGGLPPARMQAIAREFNLSETVFVLPPENNVHSARMRIFTPEKELPFAGHPTIGTAALLADLRSPAAVNGERDAIVALEEQIGTVRVGVRMREGQAAFAEFDAPRLPEKCGEPPPAEQLAGVLGLIPREIGFENHRATLLSAGGRFLHVPVTTLDAMSRLRLDMSEWQRVVTPLQCIGLYAYTRQTVHTTSSFHARMFAPDAGIMEDPATGSAAVGFAGAIFDFDDHPDGVHRRVVEQGYEMSRPSHIALTLVVKGGKLTVVRIGGHAIRVAQGRLFA